MTDYSKMALGTKVHGMEIVKCPHCHRPALRLDDFVRGTVASVEGKPDTLAEPPTPNSPSIPGNWVKVVVFLHSEAGSLQLSNDSELALGQSDACPVIRSRTSHEENPHE
jgi:hypothetical protein